jgi:hypothetical protein
MYFLHYRYRMQGRAVLYKPSLLRTVLVSQHLFSMIGLPEQAQFHSYEHATILKSLSMDTVANTK